MRNRAKSREAKQAGGGLLSAAQQLLLPMIEGMARSKQALLEWVQQVGLSALGELFERDAEQLPTVEHFQRIDPVPARVLNQILLGVSTRGYEKSLEPPPVGIAARGTSKSAASRHLIARM